MDRSPEAREVVPAFNWRRAAGIGFVALAILLIGSWVARSHPNSGYDAGYEAVTVKGEEWIRPEIEAAGGSTTALCEKLHHEADQSTSEPRYDHATFVRGCADAVDHLYGKPVQMDQR